jgi:hypothetical protein
MASQSDDTGNSDVPWQSRLPHPACHGLSVRARHGRCGARDLGWEAIDNFRSACCERLIDRCRAPACRTAPPLAIGFDTARAASIHTT